MKYFLIFAALLINLGCNVHMKSEFEASTRSNKKQLVIVDNCSSKEQQEWVANCIKDANPKSDEEPEDWIRQCFYTSVKLFCGSNCSVYTDGAVKCYERTQSTP